MMATEENDSFIHTNNEPPAKRKRSSILKQQIDQNRRISRTVSFNERCEELREDGTCNFTNLCFGAQHALVDPVSMELTTISQAQSDNHILNETMAYGLSEQSADMELTNMSTCETNTEQSVADMDITLTSQAASVCETTLTSQVSMQCSQSQSQTHSQSQIQSQSQTQSPDQTQNFQPQTQSQSHTRSQSRNESQTQIPASTPKHLPKPPQANTAFDALGISGPRLSVLNMSKSRIFHPPSQLSQPTSKASTNNTLSTSISSISTDMSETDITDLPNFSLRSSYSSAADSIFRAFADDSITSLEPTETLIFKADRFDKLLDPPSTEQFGFIWETVIVTLQSNRNDEVVDIMHDVIVPGISVDNFLETLEQAKDDLLGQSRSQVLAELKRLDIKARSLTAEIETIKKFHQCDITDGDELAVKIRGVRYPLWLIIKINPRKYPREEINIKFIVNKLDQKLYHFGTFVYAVKKATPPGQPFYLFRFVENAKRFVRFLKRLHPILY